MILQQRSLWHSIQRTPFFIKLFNWEYWPIYIANIPVIFIWLYFAIRARSLFFFSSVNPAIETGGVMGESKINILNRIPAYAKPLTVFVDKRWGWEELEMAFQHSILEFPIIAKPNVGERGFLVNKIDSLPALQAYQKKNTLDFILQEFIDYPIELSVMYHRFPDQMGKVTSVCIKETLHVVGDGEKTVQQLMGENPRAILQLSRFRKEAPDLMKQIPTVDQRIELEPIGNHCRGTMFLNGNHLIDENMRQVIDDVGQQMTDIYYGRFDMKCASPETFKQGEDFKILEFNGVASEPAHIYDPNYPILQKYKDIYRHWKIIFQISKVQQQKGVYGMGFKEAYQSLRKYFTYMKTAGE